MGGFNPQSLANTAWACATAAEIDTSLFAALSAAAVQRMGGFNPQNLANTAWAFATAGQNDPSLFAALATVPPLGVAWVTSGLLWWFSPFRFGHIFQAFFKILHYLSVFFAF